MNTMKPKFITGALFLLLLISAFTTQKANAQFMGLYTYFESDSVPGTNLCLSESVDGQINWYNAGTYIAGDYVDINVDWGDGNTSPYMGTPIIIGGGYGYINSIPVSHTYSAAGSYTVVVTSVDNYSNADADTFVFSMSDLCGDIFVNVLLDDGDGIIDGGDMAMPGVPLNLIAGTSYYGTTNTYGWTGIHDIDVNQPSYNLEPDPTWLSATGMSVITPVSGDFTVTGLSGTPQNFTFLLDCGVATYYNASIYGYGWGFRPGLSTGFAELLINNTSCSGGPAATDISLDFDPMLTVFSSSLAGGTITPGNISWTGASIPFGSSSITVYFTVPPGTPAFTPLAFQGDITSTSATDVYPSDNTAVFYSEVRNSWDPNDKSTNVPHLIDVNVQEEIVYTVRFQNMGNADALEIHISDTISNLLDLSTFKLISQSHNGSYSIDPTTREVIFTFPDINLVPESVDPVLSQGYVMYSIKENAGLSLNSDIENTAHIFFDTNPAVVTNTTSNVNVMNPAGVEDPSGLNTLVVYPTPADQFIFLNGIDLNQISTIKMYDLNGKSIETIKNIPNGMIPVSQIPNGVYLLEVAAGEYTVVRKICVQH